MNAAGDSFILRGGGQRSPHLWVLLWGPQGTANAFIAVSFTTLEAHKDQTCIIRPGEHPFVQHDTCVMYSDTRRITQERLETAFASRHALLQAPVSPELLERLRAGLFTSPYCPHHFHRLVREAFGA
jgi:hypothetical protein